MASGKYLLVIGGPTASGKTELAIRLARHYGTAILSADSRQLFRELTIGTAKPTPAERAQVPHHFINSRSIRQAYSVGEYEREALARLEELFRARDLVVLTGGSGLYIRALTRGLDDFPEVPAAIRHQWEKRYATQGLAHLQEALRQADPDYAREVDLQNPHRLIRALAVISHTGRPFSSYRRQEARPRPFTPIYLQLHRPRAELYARINARVDAMMAAGLLPEVEALQPYRRHTALQTVGYQELFDYLDGTCSLPEAVERIKRNTRRYAKRQLTWHRRDGYWKHIRPDEWERTIRWISGAMESGWQLATAEEGQLLARKRGGVSARVFFAGTGRKATACWPAGQPAESALEDMLLHETILRLEEQGGSLCLPAALKLRAREMGCTPREGSPNGCTACPSLPNSEAYTCWQVPSAK